MHSHEDGLRTSHEPWLEMLVRVMTSVITFSFCAETKDKPNQSFLSAELCSVAEGNFAQSFMGKKSKLLIENLFSIYLSFKRWWASKGKRWTARSCFPLRNAAFAPQYLDKKKDSSSLNRIYSRYIGSPKPSSRTRLALCRTA